MQETNATIITRIPGPKSIDLQVRRETIVPRGVSFSSTIFAEEAQGALIKDVDGNVFLDFAAGIGVANIGHCDDDVVAAAKEQIGKYIHTSFNVCGYAPYVEVAEKLASLAPGEFRKKVMFANSGAEAVENAIKIARNHTGKSLILSLEGAFHGRTYMAMTLTSKMTPYQDGFSPFCSDTFKIPAPYHYRWEGTLTEEELGLSCANRFATLLKGELNPNMVAALIVEPLQGEGGFIIPPKGYLRHLQQICNENGIVFICDEIQTGFCRTGRFFCSEHSDLTPDLMTVSKSLAAGFPLSAVIGRAEIMGGPIPGGIGGTFSGNPVSLAAASVVINKMLSEDFAGKARHLGEIMMERLLILQRKYPVIGDVRGQGAMIGVELVQDRISKEPDKASVGKIIAHCLTRGVIVISAGLFGNCLRFLPPLVMTDEQIAYGLNVLEEAFSLLES